MAIVGELLEGILGGRRGGAAVGAAAGAAAAGGILAESKEAILGGCWGLVMSTAFFFLTFATGLALTFGIAGWEQQLTWTAAPFVLVLCSSGFLSPFLGIMWGLRGGQYRVTQHIGCFLLYIITIVSVMLVVSVTNLL